MADTNGILLEEAPAITIQQAMSQFFAAVIGYCAKPTFKKLLKACKTNRIVWNLVHQAYLLAGGCRKETIDRLLKAIDEVVAIRRSTPAFPNESEEDLALKYVLSMQCRAFLIKLLAKGGTQAVDYVFENERAVAEIVHCGAESVSENDIRKVLALIS